MINLFYLLKNLGGIIARTKIALEDETNPIPEMTNCAGCKFIETKEEILSSERIPGWFNRDLKYYGFCQHPYKTFKMQDCAVVNYGCKHKKPKD